MTRARAATVLCALLLAAHAAPAAATLIRNGTFTDGTGDVPVGWETGAWNRDLSRFGREVAADGSAAATITNLEANDAHWCQAVDVQSGAAYRISARIKTRDVGATTAGAFIAVEPRIADSPQINGTQDWQKVEVTVEATDETGWQICPRLGSYANLNTGTAWFTDVEMIQIRKPPVTRNWVPWQAWRAWQRSGAFTIALPLVGGLLLALGLGIGIGRRAR
jgi:hypothetical protein